MAKSKFTDETRGALIERFAAGLSVPDAARAVSMNPTTLKTWLSRGRREDIGPYADFASSVDSAREAARQRPQAMDGEELARVVSEAARKGNTQAMKLRWEMILADRSTPETEEKPADPLSSVDELAERRAAT